MNQHPPHAQATNPAAQTADQPAATKSFVPPGLLADRAALTAMDYIEIHQLYARYALALDLGDGAARATTFTTGGYYANLPSGHRPVYVDQLVERTNANGNSGERHLVNNIIITPTEEGADGFAHLTMISRDGKAHTGFYNDKLVRTPEGWRFVGRHGWYDIDPDSPYRPRDESPPAAADVPPAPSE
jgi:hypothetical protein